MMVVLPENHRLAAEERLYWSDLKHEVFVVPRDGTGATLAKQLSARMTDYSLQSRLIIQDISHDTILNTVRLGRFITIATEAMQGVPWPGVVFKEVHDMGGLVHVDFSIYWRADNDNPALKQFFTLLKDRHPSLVIA